MFLGQAPILVGQCGHFEGSVHILYGWLNGLTITPSYMGVTTSCLRFGGHISLESVSYTVAILIFNFLSQILSKVFKIKYLGKVCWISFSDNTQEKQVLCFSFPKWLLV